MTKLSLKTTWRPQLKEKLRGDDAGNRILTPNHGNIFPFLENHFYWSPCLLTQTALMNFACGISALSGTRKLSMMSLKLEQRCSTCMWLCIYPLILNVAFLEIISKTGYRKFLIWGKIFGYLKVMFKKKIDLLRQWYCRTLPSFVHQPMLVGGPECLSLSRFP